MIIGGIELDLIVIHEHARTLIMRRRSDPGDEPLYYEVQRLREQVAMLSEQVRETRVEALKSSMSPLRSEEPSHFEREIMRGCEGVKPGWVER